MKYIDWIRQVNEWRILYGVRAAPPRYNPIAISTIIVCKKCGDLQGRKRFNRHHLRLDYTFACMYPKVYAARYIQFLPEDCFDLCIYCHRAAERHLKPLKQEFWKEVREMELHNHQMSIPECELWRSRFYEANLEWIKKPIKRRRKKKRKTTR